MRYSPGDAGRTAFGATFVGFADRRTANGKLARAADSGLPRHGKKRGRGTPVLSSKIRVALSAFLVAGCAATAPGTPSTGNPTAAQSGVCDAALPAYIPGTVIEPSVPEAWEAFAGWWSGMWDSPVCHHLAITSIRADGTLSFIYGWGASHLGAPGYYRDGAGSIRDGKLTFTRNQGRTFVYTPKANGILEGLLTFPSRRDGVLNESRHATLSRVPGDHPLRKEKSASDTQAGVCLAGLPEQVPSTAIEPGVPQEWKTFAGWWHGRWNSGVCNHFIVTSIRADGSVSLIYAWGRASIAPDFRVYRDRGKIESGELTFVNNRNIRFTYRPYPGTDRKLYGHHVGPYGPRSITLERVPPDHPLRVAKSAKPGSSLN